MSRLEAMAEAIGLTHRCFAQTINWELRRTGHTWENRYYSTALDESHLWTAVRYLERNPLRAKIVHRAEDYAWSSARAHALGVEDPVLAPSRPFPGTVGNWSAWLATEADAIELELLRAITQSGRPTGSDEFVARLSARLDRDLRAPGRRHPPTAEPAKGAEPGRQTPSPGIDFLAFEMPAIGPVPDSPDSQSDLSRV